MAVDAFCAVAVDSGAVCRGIVAVVEFTTLMKCWRGMEVVLKSQVEVEVCCGCWRMKVKSHHVR